MIGLYLYFQISIYDDPVVALGFGFLAVFLVIRGGSFYCIYGAQKLFSTKDPYTLASISYKMSLMLGLFALINLALIISGTWTKFWGILIFIVFILLQIITYKDDLSEQ